MEFEKMLKRVVLAAVLFALCFTLIGCQTISGLGGDIKWTADSTAELLEP